VGKKLELFDLVNGLGAYYTRHIGADPEIFIEDEKGEIIPAFAFLPEKNFAEEEIASPVYLAREQDDEDSRDERNPLWVKGAVTRKLFWDGFQAEWSTSRGIHCLAYTVDTMHFALQELLNRARKFNPNARLSVDTVKRIPDTLLETAMDHHVALGCKPSLNANGLKGKFVDEGRDLKFRFTGGHMHFTLYHADGITPYTVTEKEALIRFLDATVGVWSVAAAEKLDNPIRRKYYGLPGEWRDTPYGIEYRTPSNFWLTTPKAAHAIFEVGRAAIQLFEANKAHLWASEQDEVVRTIMKHDATHAREILHRNHDLLLFLVAQRNKWLFEPLMEMAMKPLSPIQDIAKNWLLDTNAWVTNSNHPATRLAYPKIQSSDVMSHPVLSIGQIDGGILMEGNPRVARLYGW